MCDSLARLVGGLDATATIATRMQRMNMLCYMRGMKYRGQQKSYAI